MPLTDSAHGSGERRHEPAGNLPCACSCIIINVTDHLLCGMMALEPVTQAAWRPAPASGHAAAGRLLKTVGTAWGLAYRSSARVPPQYIGQCTRTKPATEIISVSVICSPYSHQSAVGQISEADCQCGFTN